MGNVILIFSAVLAIVAAYTVSTIWSRRETHVRLLAVLGLVVTVPLTAAGALESLGWHKPVWGSWELTGEQRVLGSKLIEGEAIYLYLDLGGGEPRAIVVPWDPQVAEQLQRALRDSWNNGNPGGATMKYDHSWDNHEPQFHPLPQPQLPMPKDPPEQPRRYERGA